MEELFNNETFKSILIGLFITVIGGIILYFILKLFKPNIKGSLFKFISKGEITSKGDVTIGDNKSKLSK